MKTYTYRVAEAATLTSGQALRLGPVPCRGARQVAFVVRSAATQTGTMTHNGAFGNDYGESTNAHWQEGGADGAFSTAGTAAPATMGLKKPYLFVLYPTGSPVFAAKYVSDRIVASVADLTSFTVDAVVTFDDDPLEVDGTKNLPA